MSVAEVYELRQSRSELSLRRFARYAGVPFGDYATLRRAYLHATNMS